MTITNTTLPPQQYSGNDLTTDFPITFDYNAESDLAVSLKVDATGVVTDWTQDIGGDTGYTIVSGEVIANTAPATGTTLTIDCETAITQTVDLKNNRKTAAEIYETAYDKVTLIARDNAAKIERAIVAPASGDPTVSYTMPDYDASSYLQWHPTSKELRNASPVSISTTVGTDVGDVVALVDDGAGNGVFPSDQINLVDDDTMATVTDTQASTGESIKAYIDAQIAAAILATNPVGSLKHFPFDSVPTGYLECDGTAKSRTTYAALFAALGDLYGVGDGSTTFNLPNYGGKFLRGWDHGAGTDPDAATRTDAGDGATTGDNVGTNQADEFKSHTHEISMLSALGGSVPPGGSGTSTVNEYTLGTGGNETRPLNVYVMICIKY